jgi:CRISPR-associated protein Cmr4
LSLAFGPEEGDLHSGSLGFTDARLLLFPVKSMKGIFSWVTCPKVLERFRSDMKLCNDKFDFDMPNELSTPKNCSLYIKDKNIMLEEYAFEIKNKDDKTSTNLAVWFSTTLFPPGNEYNFWREKIKKDVVVLSDDDFRDFVNLSTEVITRTKINNETGTVQSGALFTEEYLPSESILYSLALTTPIFKEEDSEKGIFRQNGKKEEELVMEFFSKGLPEVIQLGGNATIGKGIVRAKVLTEVPEVKNV